MTVLLLLRPPPLSKLWAVDALRAIQFTDTECSGIADSAPGNLLPGTAGIIIVNSWSFESGLLVDICD